MKFSKRVLILNRRALFYSAWTSDGLCTGREAKIVGKLIKALQDDNQPSQLRLGRRRVEEPAVEEGQNRAEAFAAGFVIGQRRSYDP
jgi:hypothetical protein